MKECFMKCTPPEGGGGEKFYIAVFSELTIYGHTVDAWTKEKYPEDWPSTEAGRMQQIEFGCWHSVVCPEGEIGSNPMDALGVITYEQFMTGWDEGWPDNYPLTTDAHRPIVAISEWNPDGSIGPTVWDSLHGDLPKRSEP